MAKATTDNRSTQSKAIAGESKYHLSVPKADKGRMRRRPPSSAVTQPEPGGHTKKYLGPLG